MGFEATGAVIVSDLISGPDLNLWTLCEPHRWECGVETHEVAMIVKVMDLQESANKAMYTVVLA